MIGSRIQDSLFLDQEQISTALRLLARDERDHRPAAAPLVFIIYGSRRSACVQVDVELEDPKGSTGVFILCLSRDNGQYGALNEATPKSSFVEREGMSPKRWICPSVTNNFYANFQYSRKHSTKDRCHRECRLPSGSLAH